MRVPFLDLKSQYQAIKSEIRGAIDQVLESTSFVLGKPVEEFETAFAAAHGVRFCSGLSSGTDGNHLLLWALGLGPGDEVIVPANSFVATAWGATLCGATPVFADCNPESYTIDPAGIERAMTKKTKAIVAVHLYGHPSDMDQVRAISSHRGVPVVEDCAQSHIAEYKGRKVGGLGEAASFSFYPGKNLGAYGEAGAVTTNRADLAEKFRMMRDHGARSKYEHEILGHNYRMESIQGAILGVKLNYLDRWTELRRRVAAKYTELLSGVGDVIVPKEMSYAKHVYHLYVIQTRERERLQRYLSEKGISTGLHYPLPLHLQRCFSHLNYQKTDFPATEHLSERCLSLPIYPELSDEQVDFVAQTIRGFFD